MSTRYSFFGLKHVKQMILMISTQTTMLPVAQRCIIELYS